ncbi:hypothetical protein Q1695_000067 [Nippostrongylus brasiliensis]|nr:hypothetical protein Q1695_000067 [Nippostrongylus brasiliensis]
MQREHGYWLQLLVCVLVLSHVICTVLPADYVRFLIQAAQEDNFVSSPARGAIPPSFLRVSRNEVGKIATPADLPMFRFG